MGERGRERGTAGVTVLEVLVAFAVIGLILAIAIGTLTTGASSSTRGIERLDEMARLNRLAEYFKRSLRFARQVRLEDPEPGLRMITVEYVQSIAADGKTQILDAAAFLIKTLPGDHGIQVMVDMSGRETEYRFDQLEVSLATSGNLVTLLLRTPPHDPLVLSVASPYLVTGNAGGVDALLHLASLAAGPSPAPDGGEAPPGGPDWDVEDSASPWDEGVGSPPDGMPGGAAPGSFGPPPTDRVGDVDQSNGPGTAGLSGPSAMSRQPARPRSRRLSSPDGGVSKPPGQGPPPLEPLSRPTGRSLERSPPRIQRDSTASTSRARRSPDAPGVRTAGAPPASPEKFVRRGPARGFPGEESARNDASPTQERDAPPSRPTIRVGRPPARPLQGYWRVSSSPPETSSDEQPPEEEGTRERVIHSPDGGPSRPPSVLGDAPRRVPRSPQEALAQEIRDKLRRAREEQLAREERARELRAQREAESLDPVSQDAASINNPFAP